MTSPTSTSRRPYTCRNKLQERLAQEQQEREAKLVHVQEMIDNILGRPLEDSEEVEEKLQAYYVGALPVMCGTFEDFSIVSQINQLLPTKKGPNSKADFGTLFKAMALQVAATGFQSLSRTAEFYKKVPVDVMLGRGIFPKEINRFALSRLLDAVHEYGSTQFFSKNATHVMSSLGNEVNVVHLDSTSFHFHGKEKEGEEGEIAITWGYSRDGHSELPQIVIIGLVEHLSGLPVGFKSVSGNINDKQSFLEFLEESPEEFLKEFPGVKVIVGDSALWTKKICKSAKKIGVHLVSKMTLTNSIAQKLIAETKVSVFQRVYGDSSKKLEEGYWCPDFQIEEIPVRGLLVRNPVMQGRNRSKFEKQAAKEIDKIQKDLEKRCSNLEEAAAYVEKKRNELTLCRIEDVTYEEQWVNATKGRPRAGVEPEKKLVGVKIKAQVVADRAAIEAATEKAIRYLIVTTDVDTKWTMESLLSTYRGQNKVEGSWRLFKNKRLMAESIYLETPGRIEALMCILYLIVLLLKVTEIKLRDAMKKHSLVLPPVSNEPPTDKPTIVRLINYVRNQHITLVKDNTGKMRITNVNNILLKIFAAMGPSWLRYYLPETYEDYLANISVVNN